MKRAAITFLLAASLVGVVSAERYEIRRDTVLEATSDQDLNINRMREGDRFSVTLRESYEVPRGTQLEGRIVRVEPKRGDQAGFMDLEFTHLVVNGRERHRVNALPISLDDKKIRRDREGRLTADSKKHRGEQYVVGGLVGGLVLGALLKKPFEGAFVGTLAGIIFSEVERDRNKKNVDHVLRRGSKVGVLFAEDVRFDSDVRNDRRDDGWNRDDDRRNRDDVNWGDDRRDRDDRWEDDRNVGRDNFEYDGRAVRGNVLRDGNNYLLSLATIRSMGVDVEETNGRIYLENDDRMIRLSVDSDDYRMGGRGSGRLPTRVRNERGEIYVPIEAVAAVLPKTVKVNGTTIRPLQ